MAFLHSDKFIKVVSGRSIMFLECFSKRVGQEYKPYALFDGY